MGAFEGRPFELGRLQAKALVQDAAQPQSRGLAVGAHADALALEVGRGLQRRIGAHEEGRFLEPRRHHDRQQRDLERHAARFELGDDVIHVQLGAAEGALEVSREVS